MKGKGAARIMKGRAAAMEWEAKKVTRLEDSRCDREHGIEQHEGLD